MRRAAVVAGGVAIVMAVGFALGWWQQHRATSLPARPLAAATSLSARTLSFGDPLNARVDVLVNPREIQPESVRLRPRFAPYRIVSATLRTRPAGDALLSYRYALECLSPACVPARAQTERQFLPAFVSYRTRGGRTERQAVEWPAFTVVSHLAAADLRDPVSRLRADAPLPAVTYRIAPGTLRPLLAAASAVLVLAAALLVGLALPRRRRLAAVAERPPVERALLLVRASTENGYPAERRKALGRLARELRACGRRDLAGTAVRLAWSAQAPTPEATTAFAEEVEANL